MMKQFNYFFLLVILISCRKYPENDLWFKHPGKVLGERDYDRSWPLTYYSVNDVDSTGEDFLKAYREEGLYMFRGNKKSIEFRCPGIIGGYISFSDKKEKSLKFNHVRSSYSPDGNGYNNQRNIFMDPDIKWKIQKLNKKAFWVIGEHNNSKYEIHFE